LKLILYTGDDIMADTKFVRHDEMPDLIAKKEALEEIQGQLGPGEIGLLQTLDEWVGEYTEPQADYLEKIYGRYF
jgi:hypothetical protein